MKGVAVGASVGTADTAVGCRVGLMLGVGDGGAPAPAVHKHTLVVVQGPALSELKRPPPAAFGNI